MLGRQVARPSCAPELLLSSASREEAPFEEHCDSENCDVSDGQAERGDDGEQHEGDEQDAFDESCDSENCDVSDGQAEIGDDWEEHEDEQGHVYYFNVRSGHSQWHLPGTNLPPCDENGASHVSQSRKRAERRKRVQERLGLPPRRVQRRQKQMERKVAGIHSAPKPDPPSGQSKAARRRMRKMRAEERRHLDNNDS
eukprot:TRINITY_DN95927_c0_g1_i1.p1 TRINITY_DN95927_c0_g1~~TRINITY_DN95927_c0_g1_i1.p1  ORF type:complete len:197 (-),score=35.05 TRINITY_DN95927_c0_g1_i1:63-653(-)